MLCIAKKTIETIISTGNQAVIQVKSNQKKLFNEVKIFSEEFKIQTNYNQPISQAHGRRDSRRLEVFYIPEYLCNNLERWKYIKAIIKITRNRDKYNTKKKKWECSQEQSYYLSTFTIGAKDFCKIIQNHWKIENINHYVRDVAFKEDLSRIRKNPGNIARLRSFSMNILRNNNVSNIAGERYLNCCNFLKIFNYKELS